MGDSFANLLKRAQSYGANYTYTKAKNWYVQSSMMDLYKERKLLQEIYGGKLPDVLGPPPKQEPKQLHRLFTELELLECRSNFSIGAARDKSTKQIAMYFLWRDVISNVLVRHPDPGATISITIDRPSGWNKSCHGRFNLGVLDTRGGRTRSGFHMPWQCGVWPGKRAAELFFVAAWATYLAHEATELVHFKDKLEKERKDSYHAYPDGSRVFNVHSIYDSPNTEPAGMVTYHWQQMEACMSEQPRWRGSDRGSGAGQVVLESILGPEKAAEVWSEGIIAGTPELDKLMEEIDAIVKGNPSLYSPPVATSLPVEHW